MYSKKTVHSYITPRSSLNAMVSSKILESLFKYLKTSILYLSSAKYSKKNTPSKIQDRADFITAKEIR